MSTKKYLLLAGITTVASLYLTGKFVEAKMAAIDYVIAKPPASVSVIMPTYNEQDYVRTALFSLRDQEIVKRYPENFEFILVDGDSTDRTVELARPYVDKVIIAPRGKLTARNIATAQAKGDIIVSVDGDSLYPDGHLNTLLKPFSNPGVVAVAGSTFDKSIPGVTGTMSVLGTTISRFMTPTRLHGRNSAFWKELFLASGGFDESADQFDVDSMVVEEEISFGERMAQYGRVVHQMNAPCIHLGGSKIGCRIGTESEQLCAAYGIGVDRF